MKTFSPTHRCPSSHHRFASQKPKDFAGSTLSLSLSRIATISLAVAVLLGGVWLFNFNSPDSLALSVDNISPTSGSPSGGETVTITGSGFQTLTPDSPMNYDYSGGYETETLTAGIYKLEVWGAKGGKSTTVVSSYLGGNGGYATGDITLTADTTFYIYAGGLGPSTTISVCGNGGFNGGGYACGGGGGGGSDIRIGTGNAGSLLARVIVAGGGGGAGCLFCNGVGYAGAGGGTTGGSAYFGGSASPGTYYGGSQTGAGGCDSGGYCIDSAAGGFGYGGGNSGSGGGAGGGWYGGRGGFNGAGGSGYVLTASSYKPSGYLLGEEYYLTNAQTIAGSLSFPAPSGGTETGHADNGYARITPYTVQTPEVLFDTTPAENCVVVSDTEMTCDTPAHAAGTVPVTVDGESAGEYEYLVPTFLNLTTDKSELDMSGLPNVLIADYLTANVITNNPTGYHLDIEATEPRLTCSSYDTNYYIEPLGSAETGTMLDNKWGYSLDDGSLTTPTSWTGLTNLPVELINLSTATDLTLGQDTTVWFGTKVNMSLPACSYTGNVIISAIANGSI